MDFPDGGAVPDLDVAWIQLALHTHAHSGHIAADTQFLGRPGDPGRYVLPQVIITPDG